jgi:hypothetical protein
MNDDIKTNASNVFDITKDDARNRAFNKEYEIFKTNRHYFHGLVPAPDRFPMMCELFDAIKNHIRSLPDVEVLDINTEVRFPYFGRTWKASFLSAGWRRKNEIYIAIGFAGEPIHVPMATLAFKTPDHWEF